MQFDPAQANEVIGPVLAEEALSNVPIFGPDKPLVMASLIKAMRSKVPRTMEADQLDEIAADLPAAFYNAKTVAEKLRALRAFLKDESAAEETARLETAKSLKKGLNELSLASNDSQSCREYHEALLGSLVSGGLPRAAQNIVDHTMLFRAKEKYLFDAVANRSIVGDDPWKRYVWDWIAGKPLFHKPRTANNISQTPKTQQTTAA